MKINFLINSPNKARLFSLLWENWNLLQRINYLIIFYFDVRPQEKALPNWMFLKTNWWMYRQTLWKISTSCWFWMWTTIESIQFTIARLKAWTPWKFLRCTKINWAPLRRTLSEAWKSMFYCPSFDLIEHNFHFLLLLTFTGNWNVWIWVETNWQRYHKKLSQFWIHWRNSRYKKIRLNA